MPRQLLSPIILALLCGGCSGIRVKAPAPEAMLCPASPIQAPCSADAASPTTLVELRKAWLSAQTNAENCRDLAEAWLAEWRKCAATEK